MFRLQLSSIFFEKYLVELAKIHNFANEKKLKAEKNP